MEAEALAVVGLQVRIGGLGAEAAEVVGEVAVEDHQRVAGLGVLIEAVGEQDVRPEINGPAPELAEQAALDADVPNVFRVFWRIDGRHRLVEHDGDAGIAVELDLAGL